MVGVSEVVYAAGRFEATAVYVPQTSPPPLVAQCPPFVPSNYSTVQPTYAVAEGMAVKISCFPRARFVGNGSDTPVCLKDSTYSLARLKYSLSCAVQVVHVLVCEDPMYQLWLLAPVLTITSW